ncbi:uncharacterized protein LOC129800701 [Phlebotomus papatasi]|uniref:uncharacterized protein LOC129800701 n=1 Tax=Phlebotomus papatasi TaxID=29031 RepID=UPI002484404F|nr:uncharacterized protein LOC129800701 [Phlebotomus papatasi]
MSIFRFNKCCCIFELATGGIILGWLNLVMSIVNFVLCCVILSASDNVKQQSFSAGVYAVEFFFGILICIVTLLIVSDLLLIVGAMHKKALYTIPWLFNEFIFLLFNFIAIFLSSDFSYIMAMIAFFTFRLYLWLCVYSLYATLKEWPAVDQNNFTYSRKIFEPTLGYSNI